MYFIFLVSSQGTEGIKVAMSFPTWTIPKRSMGRFTIETWLLEYHMLPHALRLQLELFYCSYICHLALYFSCLFSSNIYASASFFFLWGEARQIMCCTLVCFQFYHYLADYLLKNDLSWCVSLLVIKLEGFKYALTMTLGKQSFLFGFLVTVGLGEFRE